MPPKTQVPLPHRTREPEPYDQGEHDFWYFLLGVFIMTVSIIVAIVTVWWLGTWVF